MGILDKHIHVWLKFFCFVFGFFLWTKPNLFSLLIQRRRRPRRWRRSTENMEWEPTTRYQMFEMNEKVLCSKPSSSVLFVKLIPANRPRNHSMAETETNNIVKNSSIRSLGILFPKKFRKSYFKSNHWLKIDLISTYSANSVKVSSIYDSEHNR